MDGQTEFAQKVCVGSNTFFLQLKHLLTQLAAEHQCALLQTQLLPTE